MTKPSLKFHRLCALPQSFRILVVFCLAAAATLVGSQSVLAAEHVAICRYCQEGASALAAEGDELSLGRKYAPDRAVDVVHLKLDVTPDFEKRTVSGTATIHFKPISTPLEELILHGVHLNVDAVRGSHSLADYSVSHEDVTIVFDEAVPVGESAYVEIDYSAEPAKGLYFCTPTSGFDESETHLWTQGEPFEARHWYPCFDSPNERSSTEVVCRVPADMTVLSNGVRLGEWTDAETDLKAVHWLQSKPHANYLLCLVAGRLSKLEKQHGDVPLAFYTQPSLAENAHNSFRDTADILAFYEEEIGVPYPWDKYYQVTVGDFMWGGMENTTLTTLTQRTIFNEETENVRSSRGLDAHEMAHQWFGDYVTCKDWSHLWLNEGFATYYTHLYDGHKFGRDALLYGLYENAKGAILPRGDDTRAIVYRQYDDPLDQFDYRAYPKGSWVLHMLRSQLGEELYRQAIRTYLQRHALSDVESEDLREAFEDVSGRTLDRFFDQWVYHARHPSVKVTYRWLAKEKLAHVTVEQTHETSDDVFLFEFPSKLRFVVDGQPVDHPIEVSQRKHEFYVALAEEPTIVRFDPEYTVLADVTFDKSDALLTAQLADESDVIGRLLACEALGKRKTKQAVELLEKRLNDDPFYGVRQTAARALCDAATDEAIAALIDAYQQSDARVRLTVVECLGDYYRDDVRDELLDIVDTEKNPAIAAAAVRSLGKFGCEATREAVCTALASETFGNAPVEAAFAAIGDLADNSLCGDVMQVLKDRGEKLYPEHFGAGLNVLAQLSKDDDAAREAAFEFFTGYLNHPRTQLRIAAAGALGALGDGRARAILRPMADDDRGGRLSRTARRALESLDDEAPTAPDELAEIRKLLREMQEKQKELQESIDELKNKSAASGSSNSDDESSAAEADADEDETPEPKDEGGADVDEAA